MKPFLKTILASAAATLTGACAHTPPGTSVEIALAKKAELFRLPPMVEVPKVAHAKSDVYVPPVEPELPVMEDRIEAEAEAFTRGKFAMEDGKDDEAIAAFEETVRLAPAHQEAWQNLAVLYEKTGAGKKAVAAFRKSKTVARQ